MRDGVLCGYRYCADKFLNQIDSDFSGLGAFESEGIQNITALKDQLVSSNHEQTESIARRHADVIGRWQKLTNDSAQRKNRLLVMQVSWGATPAHQEPLNYQFAQYWHPYSRFEALLDLVH